MELINNTTKTLKDDLSVEIKQGSRLSIAAACFSIYAFQELKEQLSQIEELRFIFTSPTFVTEKAKKERREFYIPRLTRERSLYGTEFEVKLRNELTQKAIARECAEWIRQKVTFKSNVSDKSIQGQIVVDGVGYTPINNFTTIELGCEKGNVISTTIVKDESLARTLLADFNEIWNDSKVLQVVTDEVIDSITAAYNENSPDFIYFVTLYNIFNEFLEDVSEDVLPNEATGFKESKIWGMLYNFQRDAALAIINKLEKFNGCILADSVGLGKTFTALAVIKYYENRNKSVLVLCPKKLTNNWNTYKDNYVNNPIAADRLRYDVLYHTDLNRTHGTSNGLDLDRLNWGNYDLVVIDESHNFRNGGKLVENPDEDTKDNRYVTLMKKVIRAGVKTKVLMLSATPVNNRFNDLKNQLALAYEGHTDYIDEKLNTTRSIDEIFRNAQRAFVYSKSREDLTFGGDPIDKRDYINPDNDIRGPWKLVPIDANHVGGNTVYPIKNPKTGKEYLPPNGRIWCYNKKTIDSLIADGRIKFGLNDDSAPKRKLYYNERMAKGDKKTPSSLIIDAGTTKDGTSAIMDLFNGKKLFDYPKSIEFIRKLCGYGVPQTEGFILDFFSGSATTAHAVMQLNAEDGGHRKFIMVQLPEKTDEKSEAYKAGYKTICEIGKERIRRAGEQIKSGIEEYGYSLRKLKTEGKPYKLAMRRDDDENVDPGCISNPEIVTGVQTDLYDTPKNLEQIQKEMAESLDIGFRVLKCDTSNMKEVYYNPAEYEASLFSHLEDNIKEDRTPEDLLFQVMLDLGVLLSSKIEETTIAGKKVFNVEDNYLIACFDSHVTDETITAIAKQKPYYFVMRDSSMANDSVATNFDQIFATYSPDTVRKVL